MNYYYIIPIFEEQDFTSLCINPKANGQFNGTTTIKGP